MTQMFNPPHPGEILSDWIEGIRIMDFAEAIGVTRVTLSRILNGHASVTPDIAIRLEEALGTSREMWTGLQSSFDLWKEAQKPNRVHVVPVRRPEIGVLELVGA
ncbi:HigA family addiction module antitoxin [Comamonas suwonensis]|uniref:HigA family addiction module antidote protein n=1 Tax=Comamonas suwonensis TaxID=2606214 RepID=A0A843BCR9_9BURK|nr:HigA family addiction module antitoxin [Comamonas suwonensis]MBI1627070.1 HigA family addiction module antidote protein [Comamonas suwonensis]